MSTSRQQQAQRDTIGATPPTSPPRLAPPPTSAPTSPPTRPPSPTGPRGDVPARGKRRWPIAAAAGLIGLIAVVSAVAVTVAAGNGNDDTAATPLLPVVPATIEAKFEIEAGVARGEFGRVTASPRRRGAPIVQYDENGDERWSTELPTDLDFMFVHDAIGEVLPVELWGDGAYPDVYIRFIDADTGEFTGTEIRLPGDEKPAVRSVAGRLYVWYDARVELYDPESGELQATARGSKAVFGFRESAIFVLIDDLVSAYDLDLQPIVTGVQIEHADVFMQGGGAPWQIVDEAIVTVDGERIVGKNGDGEAWVVELGLGDLGGVLAFGDDTWFVWLPDDTSVIVSASEGDDAKELWRGSEVFFADPVGSNGILLVYADNAVLLRIDGTETAETEIQEGGHLNEHRVVDNGILFNRDNGDRVDVVFVDIDGNERWTLDTKMGWMGLVFIENAVFDPATNTVYGPK